MCPKGAADGKPLCINRSQLCDEKQDCEDGADEEAACCKSNLILYMLDYNIKRKKFKTIIHLLHQFFLTISEDYVKYFMSNI